MKLRVGLLQLRSGPEPQANRAQAEPFLREAAAAGARLVLTPENTLRLDRDRARFLAAVRPEAEEPELRAWAALAREHGIYLLLGSAAFAAPDGKAFNRSVLFSPEGRILARYDKIHLFQAALGGGETYQESETIAAGAQAILADGPAGARLGLTICYDLRFPALYQRLAAAGANIITAPSAFTVPTGQAHWEILVRARAIETGAFLLAPAQGGLHADGRRTFGRTMAVGPWGEILGRLDHDEPGVLIADLDLSQVETARAKLPAWRGGPDFTGP